MRNNVCPLSSWNLPIGSGVPSLVLSCEPSFCLLTRETDTLPLLMQKFASTLSVRSRVRGVVTMMLHESKLETGIRRNSFAFYYKSLCL